MGVNKLREINKEKLQDSYKDWNELIEENKALLEKQAEQVVMIKDLQAENAELRLKSINSVNPQHIAMHPMAGADADDAEDRERDDTTQGLDIELLEQKTEKDPYAEIKLLNGEIERLYKQKIQFAENAAEEIGKLNKIIKVLSN